jgi:uncharacterized coiled-coil protein SlyX
MLLAVSVTGELCFASQESREEPKAGYQSSPAAARTRGQEHEISATAAAEAASAESENAGLKKQLAGQQAQIEALVRTVEQLRQALEAQRRLLERLSGSAQSWSPLAPNTGEVASARPVIPTSATNSASKPAALADHQGNGGGAAAVPAEMETTQGELETVADSASQTNQRLTKLESNFADTQKKADAKIKGLGNFNFSGDVRVRYEPFFQEGSPNRQRERVRGRLNFVGKVSDEVSGGISIATGLLDDVNSTNQTLTGFFTRKTIGFDRYYLTYKPKWFKPLNLTAGKMVYPWYRTPLTFDNDVNPEGFAQTLSFDMKSPVLKNITLVGFQLPFNEASGAYDSFIFGGQLQTRWKFSDKATVGLYAAGVNFNRADPIAVAIAGGTLKPSLANTNLLLTNAAGNVTGYASKYAYLDLIGQMQYNWSSRWPLTLTFNFVNNTRAINSERSGYWSEVTFGQLREAKDIQFGYSYIRIEREAVIGAFNESDLRASTNVKNHRVQLGYQTFNNVTLQWTMWLGKLADPFQNTSLVPSGIRSACTTAPFTNCRDSQLNRMQFDVIYKF